MRALQGMIHVSEMGWSRVEHPDDVVRPGQALRCKVIQLDREKDKVYLSLKARRSFLGPPSCSREGLPLAHGALLSGNPLLLPVKVYLSLEARCFLAPPPAPVHCCGQSVLGMLAV